MGDISKKSKVYKVSEINEIVDLPTSLKLEINGVEWDFNEFAQVENTYEIAYLFSVCFWRKRSTLRDETKKVYMYAYGLFWEFISVRHPNISTLNELNFDLLAEFLSWLKDKNTTKYKKDTSRNTNFSQDTVRHVYGAVKTTIEEINRYQNNNLDTKLPNANFKNSRFNTKKTLGFNQSERMKIVEACKKEFNLIDSGAVTNIRHIYIPYILTIALRTGFNVQPLLDLRIDSVCESILEGRIEIKTFKNRGYSSQISSQKKEEDEETAIVSKNITLLLDQLIAKSSSHRINASPEIAPFIFLVPKQDGSVSKYNPKDLWVDIQRFRDKYDLLDGRGEPLEMNVRRFRPTFASLLLKKSGGDIRYVQKALNHSSIATTSTYFDSNQDEFKASFKFNGVVMQHSLTGSNPEKLASDLNISIQEAESLMAGNNRMKVSSCKNPFKPPFKKEDLSDPCTAFNACFRCSNQIITADDSHKIFSYYWWLLDKKNKMPLTAWNKAYEWIIRMIDTEVTEKLSAFVNVVAAKENARLNPHAAWTF